MNRRHTDPHVRRRAWCALLVLLMAIATVLDVQTPRAAADEGDAATADVPGVALSVESLTAVVTETSGFSATLTVENRTTQTMPAGVIDILTNPDYNFVSRTDVQEWADGVAQIDTTHELAHADVAPIPAGGRVSVHADLSPHASALAALTTWGPRPLRILYTAQTADGAQPTGASLNTYITRSQDGVAGERTPSIGMSVVMPLTSHGWSVDTQARQRLITSNESDVPPSAIATLGEDDRKALHDKDQLSTKYPQLQVVADPSVLETLGTPHLTALMQPARFDITAYARADDPQAYARAGVGKDMWSAESALAQLRGALSDTSASAPTIAWQGSDSWTMDALDAAREAGYDTVIATGDFNIADDSTAQTLVYRVPTEHGDVTVLGAQPTLTALANAHASSQHARAERTDAGRIARFIAQSAFYQMEQPYAQRTLLVCFGEDATAQEVRMLMDALGDASWIDLKSLADLTGQDTLIDSALTPQLIDENVGLSAGRAETVRETLVQLGASRDDLTRLASSILGGRDGAATNSGGAPKDDANDDGDADATDTSSPTASAAAKATVDAQSAPPEASDGSRLTESAYARRLLDAHDTLALFALQGDAALCTSMGKAAQELADAALGAITLSPSGNISVLSETASMPVTVSNGLPFPIDVRVSSRTDAIEIVTARMTPITVPAHGEAQASISIRVTTSGTAVAREQLVDRDGVPFGAVQQTSITSSLQISDKSGLVIIIIAVALGLLGLWRQFHRKKDPDE
ncbi:DUF6049 family protein [Bifidobacterium castoris]|uniref:Secreted protein n=1 Tax=Bifidobacterium castoris TaxID=2306972 RepID=A0A430F840_9BIFI|nr:DUF6049 family protein [Bifidobacterium castoris]RSX49060.1 hypothetical protein D2E22_0480 [Bifidobacterium castoris]